jgi:GNAT superfamily N-acetyltransferase
MKIEDVSKEDVDELKELARSAILESVEASDDIKVDVIADTMRHIDRNISNSERVFLKCTDSSILGFILVQNYWNLSDLYVLPALHSRGIGQRLFLVAKEKCVGIKGKSYIRVNSSLNAEGFYRKVGFVSFFPEKEVPDFVVPLIYNF